MQTKYFFGHTMIARRKSRRAEGDCMKKILLTGGGTGGHIYPNIALIPALERRGFDVIYGGAEGESAEARIAKVNRLEFFGVPCVKLVRSASPAAMKNNLTIPRVLSAGKKQAQKILEEQKPDVVFSKGGFAALPFVLAAHSLKIPVICHESDSTLGISNRIAKSLGAKVLTAYPDVNFGEFVGMPVREELFCKDGAAERRKLGISPREKVLLVVGGSSGAQAMNEAVAAVLPSLVRLCTVIHITGKGKTEGLPPRSEKYIPLEYSDDMGSLYAAADAVLSRAGATAVAELAALGKRAIVVPLPKGVSRGDQIPNAELARKFGASVLVQDDKFIHRLYPAVKKCMESAPMKSISCDANGKIAYIADVTMRRGVKCKDKKR